MSHPFLSRLHRFIALLIGLQLFIWLISGLVFSFIDHDSVDAKHLYQAPKTPQIERAFDPNKIIKIYPEAVAISQQRLLDGWVIKVKSLSPTTKAVQWDLLDSQSLQPIQVSADTISKIASAGYQGDGELLGMQLVKERNDENRDFDLPVWRLVYADREASHLYFSATSGEYLGARTTSWRVFDFFMMLHFMDYFERDNFNQPLVIVAALVLLFFTLSGLLLLKNRFSAKDFIHLYQKLLGKKRIKLAISLADGQSIQLFAEPQQRLFDLLKDHQIPVESLCGGGGICGRCKVKLPDLQGETPPEDKHKRISDEEWRQGYRLSCQTYIEQAMRVEF